MAPPTSFTALDNPLCDRYLRRKMHLNDAGVSRASRAATLRRLVVEKAQRMDGVQGIVLQRLPGSVSVRWGFNGSYFYHILGGRALLQQWSKVLILNVRLFRIGITTQVTEAV